MIKKQIKDFGCRLYDNLIFKPAFGKKRTIKLNRRSYLLDNSIQKGHSYIHLPVLDDKAVSLRLELRNIDGSERFHIKTLDNSYFLLNGNWVQSAYLQRGDKLNIGYNQLNFTSSSNEETMTTLQILNNRFLMKSKLNILLEGETGTGKSSLAKKIHTASGRKGAFVKINLSALAPGLLESELFGHIKGSFTGAHRDKKGAFLQAHGGTLFLDEIDSIDLATQTKLLLFLDEQFITPVGGNKSIFCDVRLVFASGKDLKQMVSSGKMRQDFYFRLSNGHIEKLKP
ncbi:MAG: sigma-54 factor interaction domain-containing protein, partial [Bacteriovoracia bacterium]